MEGEVIVGFIIIGLLVCVLIAEIRTRKHIQNMLSNMEYYHIHLIEKFMLNLQHLQYSNHFQNHLKD